MCMNVGKTLFAQLMEFLPWTSFARIVDRYSGNAGVRTLSCAEQFRAMAFAQLTWRESLRDRRELRHRKRAGQGSAAFFLGANAEKGMGRLRNRRLRTDRTGDVGANGLP